MGKNKPQLNNPAVRQEQIVRASVVRHSGPLPPPEELQAYNQAIPNGADRIVKMAENQSAHRIDAERHVIYSQQSQAIRGQYFGLFVVVIAISCATYAAISGAQTFACVLGGTSVVGLATAFLGGKYLQRKDLSEKAKSTPEPNQTG